MTFVDKTRFSRLLVISSTRDCCSKMPALLTSAVRLPACSSKRLKSLVPSGSKLTLCAIGNQPRLESLIDSLLALDFTCSLCMLLTLS